MMTPISYKEWVEKDFYDRKASKKNKDKIIECFYCNGHGAVNCECSCPFCESEIDCDTCDGQGEISIDELDVSEYKPSKKGYADRVFSDMKKLAHWKGVQLFDVCGGFVREFRKEHKGVI